MIHRRIFSRKSFIEEKPRILLQKAGNSLCMKEKGQGYTKKKIFHGIKEGKE